MPRKTPAAPGSDLNTGAPPHLPAADPAVPPQNPVNNPPPPDPRTLERTGDPPHLPPDDAAIRPNPQDTAEDPPIGGSSPRGEAITASRLRYESRISIVDAWQYPGTVAEAPSWVDRNWIGFADEDPVRGIEAGPCLRVPRAAHEPSSGDIQEVVLCRVGDYVARQSVQGDDGTLPVIRVEVWAREQFEKLFIAASPPQINAGVRSTRLATPARVGDDPALDEYVSQ